MRRLFVLGIPVCLFLLAGCGGSDPKVNVADLDKVLELFEKTLKEKAPAGKAAPAKNPGGQAKLQEVQNDAAKTAKFLTSFAKKLNDAKLVKEPIGVHMLSTGAVEGFIDKDKNMKKSGTAEKQLFTIQIDKERNRLVASQTVEKSTYHRDRPYHYRPGGFFMGYMLGNMMSRQRGYYRGRSPGFSSMKMSKRGYHSAAVSKARTSARARTGRSARSGRSGGFRGGK